VEIASEPPPFYVRIPRAALREGGMVWVAASGRLQMRPVTVLREEENEVVITSGIDPSDAVIISRLPVATDGMEIRTSA
jgi:multidrug efflux pump subunit AcrA (membrane-fusion protein)